MYQLSSTELCPVRIFNFYLSKLPKTRTCTAMYLQPRKKYSPHSWFLNKPVGVNTLRRMSLKELCKTAGLPGYYTNHSLRSSCATRLYVNDIDEQLIQEVTGHRSLAVRSYKRTCEAQRRKLVGVFLKKKIFWSVLHKRHL